LAAVAEHRAEDQLTHALQRRHRDPLTVCAKTKRRKCFLRFVRFGRIFCSDTHNGNACVKF
jgi:hypothetical protein